MLLVWCREVPLPRVRSGPVAAVAAASMVIFVSHFRLFPVLDRNLDKEVAYVATIAAGVGDLGRRRGRQQAGQAAARRCSSSRRLGRIATRPAGVTLPWTDPGLVARGREARAPAGPARDRSGR